MDGVLGEVKEEKECRRHDSPGVVGGLIVSNTYSGAMTTGNHKKRRSREESEVQILSLQDGIGQDRRCFCGRSVAAVTSLDGWCTSTILLSLLAGTRREHVHPANNCRLLRQNRYSIFDIHQ